MAANILNSPAAVRMSVQVVRAFIGLRKLMVNHRALSAQLRELEGRVTGHDGQLSEIIATIRRLTMPDTPVHGRKIGFHRGNR